MVKLRRFFWRTILLWIALWLPSLLAEGFATAGFLRWEMILFRGPAALGAALLTGYFRKRWWKSCWTGLYSGAAILEFTSIYLSGRSFGFEFFFHLSPTGLTNGFSEYIWVIGAALLYWGGISLAAAQWVKLPVRRLGGRSWKLPAFFLLLLCFPSPLFQLGEGIFQTYFPQGRTGRGPNPVRECFKSREQVKAFPGKNLLLIYLESTEAAYLDETLFPGLLPHTRKLWQEALVFDNLNQSDRGHFTFGALYASQTGAELTSLQLPLRHNDGINPAVGDRLATLPSILKNAGYFTSFMQSATLAFAGTNVLLKYLGYDDAWAAQALSETAKKQLELNGDWGGCRDRMLFQLAYRKLRFLAAQKRPFLLTVMTIDGHHPAGFVDRHTIPYRGRKKPLQLLNALHTTDAALGEFIARLKRLPEWKNLTVIILSDHLSMPAAETDYLLRPLPNRRLLALALNAGQTGRISTPGKTWDLAPTILALGGVRHDWEFPLGANLLEPNPPPLRLEGDRQEKLPYLESYLRKQSSHVMHRDRVKLSANPYWSLQLGNLTVPLFGNAYGEQLPLRKGECFLIRITLNGLVGDARRFEAGAPGIKDFLERNAEEFILLGNDSPDLEQLKKNAGSGLRLLRGRPGHWIELPVESPEAR